MCRIASILKVIILISLDNSNQHTKFVGSGSIYGKMLLVRIIVKKTSLG